MVLSGDGYHVKLYIWSEELIEDMQYLLFYYVYVL